MYADDPWGRIGYMHDAMFRGVRLVVDSGMHAMRWTREKAVKYYVDALGDPETSAITEIERYCVEPGQACGYMLGKLEFLRLRDKAKVALGAKFDIRQFPRRRTARRRRAAHDPREDRRQLHCGETVGVRKQLKIRTCSPSPGLERLQGQRV